MIHAHLYIKFPAKNSTCMIKSLVIKCKDIINVIFHLLPSMINDLQLLESVATCWIMLCVKDIYFFIKNTNFALCAFSKTRFLNFLKICKYVLKDMVLNFHMTCKINRVLNMKLFKLTSTV